MFPSLTFSKQGKFFFDASLNKLKFPSQVQQKMLVLLENCYFTGKIYGCCIYLRAIPYIGISWKYTMPCVTHDIIHGKYTNRNQHKNNIKVYLIKEMKWGRTRAKTLVMIRGSKEKKIKLRIHCKKKVCTAVVV